MENDTKTTFAGTATEREWLIIHAAQRDFQLGYNPATGRLEIAVGTNTYTARIDLEIDEDGAYFQILHVNGEEVEEFPVELHRARLLAKYAESMGHQYAQAFAPVAEATSAESAYERAIHEVGR